MNIKVTEVKFMNKLLPQENQFLPFCSSQDVRAEDLPDEVNKKIWREIKKGHDIVPVRFTIQIDINSANIADDVADEVLAVARRALKSIEYLNKTDRGAINSGDPIGDKPFVFTMKVNPLSVIEALTSGYPYNVRVTGFLTRAN